MTVCLIGTLVAFPCACLCGSCILIGQYVTLEYGSLTYDGVKKPYSGAKYPVVPNTRVEMRPLILSDPIFAKPKSDTLALKF